MLRVVAALAIIVYAYDILQAIVFMVNPLSLGENAVVYYSGDLALTEAGALFRNFVTFTLLLSIAISLLEVYGGICGLKGHSSKRETIICLLIACYCVFCAVFIIAFEPKALPECIEYAVSGVVAYLLWHFGRATIALHAAVQREAGGATASGGRFAATREDYALGLQVVGGILILFSLWSVVQAALGFFNPPLLGFRSDDLDLMDPTFVFILVIVVGIMEIALSLAQMYVGYLAYKKAPTRTAIAICLVFFILTVIGILSRILSSGSTTLDDFAEVSCAGTMLLYLIYCKKLNTLEREARSAA